jgi:hypothetical protein
MFFAASHLRVRNKPPPPSAGTPFGKGAFLLRVFAPSREAKRWDSLRSSQPMVLRSAQNDANFFRAFRVFRG